MTQSFKTFWLPGLIAIALIALLITFQVTMIPFVDHLLTKSGPPGLIAAIVLGTTFWTLFALLIRGLLTRKEKTVIVLANKAVENFTQGQDMDQFLSRKIGIAYDRSALKARFVLVKERLSDHNRSDRAALLMAGQSGVDVAHSQTAYGPLRALVWALPALGFMGTAFEMASAVGGLGMALGKTQGYNDLRNLLVGEVVPHLAGAFDITLFALGSSVFSFLLLALVNAREETILNEGDNVSIKFLAMIQDERQSSGYSFGIEQRMTELNEQLGRLYALLERFQQDGGVELLVPMLNSMHSSLMSVDSNLGSVRSNLEQERVIVVGSPTRVVRGDGRL